jgi:hypothetical protein
MLTRSSDIHQTNLFGQDLLLQLDPDDPLRGIAQFRNGSKAELMLYDFVVPLLAVCGTS